MRRVDGRGLGRFFAEEIAGRARADFWIGLPEAREERVSPVVSPPPEPPPGVDPSQMDMSRFMGPHLVAASTLNGMLPQDAATAAADRRYRAAELGAAGGVTNARGLSRMYAWLLEAFGQDTLADILRPETGGPDLVLSSPAMTIEQKFGRGFLVSSVAGGPAFGHDGAGGITAFADPGNRLAFGYTTTRLVLGPPGADPRASALVRAVYDALG